MGGGPEQQLLQHKKENAELSKQQATTSTENWGANNNNNDKNSHTRTKSKTEASSLHQCAAICHGENKKNFHQLFGGKGGRTQRTSQDQNKQHQEKEPACDCGKPKDDKDEDETNLEGMHH